MASSKENPPSEEGKTRNSYDRDASSASFQYLLRTNDPPPESEAHRLRTTLLSDAQKDLEELKEKHARLLASAAEVQEERDALEKFIDNHKVILSPIRRVPPEILSEIFLNLRHVWYDVFNVNAGPWLLGQVCSRWRSAALSYPRLWDSMNYICYGKPQIPKDPVSLLEMAIARSGQHDLRLRFSFDPSIEVHGRLLDMLMSHSGRWKTIDFRIPPPLFHRLAQIGGQLPSLTKLGLTVHEDGRALFATSFTIAAFQDTPVLRTVTLGGYSDPLAALTLPWTQLIDLTLEHVPMGCLSDILRIASKLTDLTISSSSSQDPSTTTPTVWHRSLTTLRVYGDGMIPSNIVLPNLTEVDIAAEGTMEGFTLDPPRCNFRAVIALSDLIHRSRSPLRKLSLCDVETDEILIQLLENAANVAELSITFSNFRNDDDDFFEELLGKGDADMENSLYYDPDEDDLPLLPKLEFLDINFWCAYEGLTAKFVNADFALLISNRLRVADGLPVSKIRRVHVTAHDDAEFPELDSFATEEFQDLKKDGLDISICIDDKSVI